MLKTGIQLLNTRFPLYTCGNDKIRCRGTMTLDNSYQEEVARYVRLTYERRLTPGVGGNMSCKVGDRIYITPALANMRELKAEEVVVVDLGGNPLSKGRPAIETPMHTFIYEKHPDVSAILHVHAPYAVALSFLVDKIDLITVEARYLLGPVPVVPETRPGAIELAKSVSATVKKLPEKITGVDLLGEEVCRAVVIKTHGVVTVGKTLREAFDLAEILEDTCRVAYLRDTWKS